MNKVLRYLVVTLVGMALLTVSASAQVSSPIKLYAGGGLSYQHKPPVFHDWYKTGYHLMAGVGYDVIPMVEAVGTFEYHNFSNNLDGILGGEVGGGEIKAAMFGIAGRLTPSLPAIPIKPYAQAGIGFAKITQSDFDFPSPIKVGTAEFWNTLLGLEDQTKFYYSFGGGVRYKLIPKVSLFAEARYTTIQIDGGDTAFDNPLRFWAVTGGVRLL
jgi:opacity protein-like surface antigen